MERKSKNIQTMFDDIARNYDFLNRILSFRRDEAWRKAAVKAAGIKDGMKILDLACGTGDVTAEIRRQSPGCFIVGGDFSVNMLKIGKEKLPNEIFAAADAQNLPFKDASFDRVLTAFGFRNVTDKEKALSEIYRTLKPGGRLCILEFSQPKNRFFSKVYKFYFRKILPFAGGLISGNRKAYEYLPDSVYKFPEKPEYVRMIEKAGFKIPVLSSMTFGIVSIAVMDK